MCPVLQPLASPALATGQIRGKAKLVGSVLYYPVRLRQRLLHVPQTHILTPPPVGPNDEVQVVLPHRVTVEDAATGRVRTPSGLSQHVDPRAWSLAPTTVTTGGTAEAFLARDQWVVGDPSSAQGAVQLLGADGRLTAPPAAGTALASILGTYGLQDQDVWIRVAQLPEQPSTEDKLRMERIWDGLLLQASQPREPLFAAALAVCSHPVPFAVLKQYRGSLLERVQQDRQGTLQRWPAIWTQMREIGEALRKRNMAHHNIKLDNLLVKSWDPVELKLADFDQLVVVDPSIATVHYGRGTTGQAIVPAPLMSPEYGALHLLRGGSWDVAAADAWSLGRVGFAVYTGRFAPQSDAPVAWHQVLAQAQAEQHTTADYRELAAYLEEQDRQRAAAR